MYVSVVVPCYRSSATLPALVARLEDVLSTAVAGYEVVLVVDGGDRATWTTALELQRSHPHVGAVRLSRNYGQHNALVAGVRAARHDVTVTMDDDLQHPPEEIPALLAALTEDVDLVYGVAAEEEHGAGRSFSSRLAKAAMERVMAVRDARQLSAFRAFRTFLRDGFTTLNGPHACLDVALSWGTTHITAVTVRMDERAEGESGYTFRKLVQHTVNMVLGYSTAPLRLVTYLGAAVGLLGFALLARVLFLYFSGQTTVAGFTTVASLVSLFASAQMIAIGTLGEYLGRVHTNGQGRPTYVIRAAADPRPAATVPAPAGPARDYAGSTAG
ncbi:glycosyltransferase family 2 protein [Spirilliplanes yamanashiensis]|uniref:Undecaprenyl-phosphate 4-deoxy-4-formamido-L-arabinose transferase n=1 Tax=Spirilliplanes yamanashiensis TaxID=42233 RepID=A0A8J4DM99_9ACTN|nr:glycosyltransferase family 2 protein [Spirilliplanes yamanashiensis]MDP9816472.1 undecaprenyl-phosphate 4-deoxy-4-formamido-L-arabinose transferase [Spirilliplanes yamanashiensis]GIJ05999.1 undecaprenyl-phosphate 4-deoxy-4-formamido-L-arabinose transferase [Spirilliplanes yamanashiensis]